MSNYVTTFEILGEGERVGPLLIQDVKDVVEEELRESGDGHQNWDAEFGINEEAGFAEISAERPHPQTDEFPIRLEVRLCSRGEKVYAEVWSRFLMTSAGEPPSLRSGPGRLLQKLTEEFTCTIGRETLSYEPLMVIHENAQEYITSVVTSVERKLPVLSISAFEDGKFDIDPQAAQRILAGVALVAAYHPDAMEVLRRTLRYNVLCRDGAVRLPLAGMSG